MNYRALEDLIGILVKKAGYKLSDLKIEEDIDVLKDRKKYLEGEINTLKTKLDTFEYIDKDDRQKDEEEKEYLEKNLGELNNNLNELDNKLNDKNTKPNTRSKIEGERVLLANEIANVKEQLELTNLKLQNKAYFDFSAKSKDEVSLSVLESELKEVNDALNEKYINPVLLGHKLLDAFKDNKSIDVVGTDFEILLDKARIEFDKTNNEVKDSNIFELMDRYTGKKRDVSTELEQNEYNSEEIKQELFEKEKYHNSRLENFRATLDSIEKRKEELRILTDESKKLYDSIHKEIVHKEKRLKELTNVIFNETNLVIDEEEYNKSLNDLRNEIVDDKFLENKYNRDVQSFKEELKTLDINYTNINTEIVYEERSLEIIHEKLNTKVNDIISKLQDKADFLVYSNRVDSLVNEQQYLYVNVDVIKEEVSSIWGKGDDSTSFKARSLDEKPVVEEVVNENDQVVDESIIEDVTSMYDEEAFGDQEEAPVEVLDYLE